MHGAGRKGANEAFVDAQSRFKDAFVEIEGARMQRDARPRAQQQENAGKVLRSVFSGAFDPVRPRAPIRLAERACGTPARLAGVLAAPFQPFRNM